VAITNMMKKTFIYFLLFLLGLSCSEEQGADENIEVDVKYQVGSSFNRAIVDSYANNSDSMSYHLLFNYLEGADQDFRERFDSLTEIIEFLKKNKAPFQFLITYHNNDEVIALTLWFSHYDYMSRFFTKDESAGPPYYGLSSGGGVHIDKGRILKLTEHNEWLIRFYLLSRTKLCLTKELSEFNKQSKLGGYSRYHFDSYCIESNDSGSVAKGLISIYKEDQVISSFDVQGKRDTTSIAGTDLYQISYEENDSNAISGGYMFMKLDPNLLDVAWNEHMIWQKIGIISQDAKHDYLKKIYK
jgi:hypothetical protein